MKYTNCVWSPYRQMDVEKIERVRWFKFYVHKINIKYKYKFKSLQPRLACRCFPRSFVLNKYLNKIYYKSVCLTDFSSTQCTHFCRANCLAYQLLFPVFGLHWLKLLGAGGMMSGTHTHRLKQLRKLDLI